MNNVVNMVNYYLLHKNADDSVIEYIKEKISKSNINELIVIQIELLYTDPSDKLVSTLVKFINEKINDILNYISLDELINLISNLKININNKEEEILNLKNTNDYKFKTIKTKDLNNDNKFDNEDSVIASSYINEIENNNFIINKLNSEINSIKIWLKNLENSLNKKINNSDLKELIDSYAITLKFINRDEFVNEYINKLSINIEKNILNQNILNTITNIMPELDVLYKNSYNDKNELYKLLDYYIDVVDQKIKAGINNMIYEEKLILKEKINIISKEILENDNPLDDFKVQVINSYLRYL